MAQIVVTDRRRCPCRSESPALLDEAAKARSSTAERGQLCSERVAVNLSSRAPSRKCPPPCVPCPQVRTGVSNHAPCIAFEVNQFSTSDRSQPPEMCFGGNSPFLHQRKSVERLTPTTRTTSLVLMRASMPAKRSTTGARLGVPAGRIFGVLTAGTTSMSDSCVGRSSLAAFCRLEAVMTGRPRFKARWISRGLVVALPGLLGTATAPRDRFDMLTGSANCAPVSPQDRCITLQERAAYH